MIHSQKLYSTVFMKQTAVDTFLYSLYRYKHVNVRKVELLFKLFTHFIATNRPYKPLFPPQAKVSDTHAYP